MGFSQRKQAIDLLNTISSAIKHARNNYNQANILINDSRDALNSIVSFLCETEPGYDNTEMVNLEKKLENYEKLNKVSREQLLVFSEKKINEIIKELENIQKTSKIKALFLPYKASMWTSLESIWKAADEDPCCDAVVVPIPYHELDKNMNKVNICYEGDEYPDYVNIRRFWDYNIPDEKPDVIFIHNPFDDSNTLTRVPEEYYSRNLKKYTSKLVYSPYYTFLVYRDGDILEYCNYEVTRHADVIIAQSNEVKKKYEECSHNRGKVLPLGSPKMDAIINMKDNNVPEEWKKKIKGKNVFLLTTTLTFFMQYGDKAVERLIEVFDTVTKHEESVLIWRPHPLEISWIKKNNLEALDVYMQLRNVFAKSENAILDETSDYRVAMSISKAMFSTFCSLVNEFMATGRPVYIIQQRMPLKGHKIFVDYSYNYHYGEKTISKFIDDVISGEEEKLYENRIAAFNKCFVNGRSGKCGEEVYKTVKKQIINGDI